METRRNQRKIIPAASNEIFKRILILLTGKGINSHVAEMEKILIGKIKERRKRGRKVSQWWICINA